MTETERIEALEAALAHITGDRERERATEQARLDHLEGKDRPEPTGWAGDLLKLQQLQREAREKAREEQDRRYQEQLAANAPKRAKLVAQLDEIGKRRQAANDSYAAALAKFGEEHRKVDGQLAELDRMPEMPEPDYSAADAAAREMAIGTVNGIPIQKQRRRPRSVMGF
jgi:hypothetical protein